MYVTHQFLHITFIIPQSGSNIFTNDILLAPYQSFWYKIVIWKAIFNNFWGIMQVCTYFEYVDLPIFFTLESTSWIVHQIIQWTSYLLNLSSLCGLVKQRVICCDMITFQSLQYFQLKVFLLNFVYINLPQAQLRRIIYCYGGLTVLLPPLTVAIDNPLCLHLCR